MASQNPALDDFAGVDWLDLIPNLEGDPLNTDDWLPNFLREDETVQSTPTITAETPDNDSSPSTLAEEGGSSRDRHGVGVGNGLESNASFTPSGDSIHPSVLLMSLPKQTPVVSTEQIMQPWQLPNVVPIGLDPGLDQDTGLAPFPEFVLSADPLSEAPLQPWSMGPSMDMAMMPQLIGWPGPALPHRNWPIHSNNLAGRALDMPMAPLLSLPMVPIPQQQPLISETPKAANHGPRGSQSRRQTRRGPQVRSDVLTTDLAPKMELKYNERGQMQGAFMVSGLNTKVRRRMTEQERAATANARKRGACEKCRKMRVRCDMPDNPYEPCGRCSHVSVIRQPCIRVKFFDLQLHRLGSTRDNALYDWLSIKDTTRATLSALVEHRHKIRLTQGFGFEVEVTVARFQPLPGDKTAYPWRDSRGEPRELELPPYYIVDMDDHQEILEKYNQDSYLVYIQRLLKGKTPLMVWTLQEAIRYARTHQSRLVQDCLRLWAGSRLTELPWTICGEHTLGQSPVEELDCPRSGTIPIPPIMDTQMDHLVIKMVMNPLRQRILSQLHSKILEKRRENWYEIYLAMFVIMSNMERQFAQVLYIFDWYGMESKFGTRGNSSVSESFIHSCKTLLAFFHFADGGHKPLAIDWRSSTAPQGIMTESQTDYLEKARAEIDRQGSEIGQLKGKSIYDTELYWCHQLMLGGCRVDQQNDREIDELKEADYIFHWSDA